MRGAVAHSLWGCHAWYMTRFRLISAIAGFGLTCSMLGSAQEQGSWRAASSTAHAITGDIAFSTEKILISFSSFPTARIRGLNPAEMTAAFDAESVADSAGSLYRLNIPASKKFLHKNSLCGGDDTQWVATFVSGRNLELAFFSGQTMPVFTLEAIANSTNLCGIFSYSR